MKCCVIRLILPQGAIGHTYPAVTNIIMPIPLMAWVSLATRKGALTSRISLNAHAILQNKTAGLIYGVDFEFVDVKNPNEAAECVENLYCGYVRQPQTHQQQCRSNPQFGAKPFSVDDVQILSPMRKWGVCSTDALNKEIQNAINPASLDKPEIVIGSKRFRLQDKVMQTKNKSEISNGDIGYIRQISKAGAQIDFGYGRCVVYGTEEMASIDLAYAVAIHKSQGSEYPVVIIPILNDAGITRTREKVIIAGQRRAFSRVIYQTDVAMGNAALAQLILG